MSWLRRFILATRDLLLEEEVKVLLCNCNCGVSQCCPHLKRFDNSLVSREPKDLWLSDTILSYYAPTGYTKNLKLMRKGRQFTCGSSTLFMYISKSGFGLNNKNLNLKTH